VNGAKIYILEHFDCIFYHRSFGGFQMSQVRHKICEVFDC
jgi:hypothetical protein